jgi:hypothetical protein
MGPKMFHVEHSGLELLIEGLTMFHVEQCDRTKPYWCGHSKPSKIHIGPAVWAAGWGFTHHYTPSQPHQTYCPLQGLEWGAKATAAGGIKGVNKAFLFPQYIHVATHHFNLVLDPQRLL